MSLDAWCRTCYKVQPVPHDCFPPAKPLTQPPTFTKGDTVIVTTACEDVALHELTGVVSHISDRTRSVIVKMDVDDSKLPFLPHEIGHRW